MSNLLNGKKTYLGIALWVATEILTKIYPEYTEILSVLSDLAKGLIGLGAAHKLAKLAPKPEVVSEK